MHRTAATFVKLNRALYRDVRITVRALFINHFPMDQQKIEVMIEPDVAKGRYADTVNINANDDRVCLTFSLIDQDTKQGYGVARVFMPWSIATFIGRTLSSAATQRVIAAQASSPLRTPPSEAAPEGSTKPPSDDQPKKDRKADQK